MKLFIKISYRGTAYGGYQVQNNAPTIQKELTDAASVLFGGRCDIVGCSRTDSGVHANEFCATVSKKKESFIETSIPISRIPQAMSHWLPSDIAVFAAEEVEDSFHPRYDVKYKEYEYKILNRQVRDPFLEGRVWHCPKQIDEEGFENMKRAAAMLVGRRDFSSFMAADSTVKDTVREVFSAEIEREGDLVTFRVSADGFLYNMVRIFTGTLVEVAYGKIAVEDIPHIIEAHDRRRAGCTAPPEGLYLNRVVY